MFKITTRDEIKHLSFLIIAFSPMIVFSIKRSPEVEEWKFYVIAFIYFLFASYLIKKVIIPFIDRMFDKFTKH